MDDKYLEQMKQIVPYFVVKAIESVSRNKQEQTKLFEEFVERVGIMEFDGGLSRYQAEREALECVINNHRMEESAR